MFIIMRLVCARENEVPNPRWIVLIYAGATLTQKYHSLHDIGIASGSVIKFRYASPDDEDGQNDVPAPET